MSFRQGRLGIVVPAEAAPPAAPARDTARGGAHGAGEEADAGRRQAPLRELAAVTAVPSAAPARPGHAPDPSLAGAPRGSPDGLVAPGAEPALAAATDEPPGEAFHPGLRLLERVLREAARGRARLAAALPAALARRDAAHRALEDAFGKPFRALRRRRIAALEADFAEAAKEAQALGARLVACRVPVGVDLDRPAMEAFAALAAAHALLASADRIWELCPAGSATTPLPGPPRSPATADLADPGGVRRPVSFGTARSGPVASDPPGLRLTDATGMALDLYPGFGLVHDEGAPPRQRGEGGPRIAVLDLRELRAEATTLPLLEAGEVPRDAASAVVGHGWSRLREDGTPDLRHPDTRRLPILRYGTLRLQGPGGIDLTYVISRAEAATGFAEALERMQAALDALAARSLPGTEAVPGRAFGPAPAITVPHGERHGGAGTEAAPGSAFGSAPAAVPRGGQAAPRGASPVPGAAPLPPPRLPPPREAGARTREQAAAGGPVPGIGGRHGPGGDAAAVPPPGANPGGARPAVPPSFAPEAAPPPARSHATIPAGRPATPAGPPLDPPPASLDASGVPAAAAPAIALGPTAALSPVVPLDAARLHRRRQRAVRIRRWRYATGVLLVVLALGLSGLVMSGFRPGFSLPGTEWLAAWLAAGSGGPPVRPPAAGAGDGSGGADAPSAARRDAAAAPRPDGGASPMAVSGGAGPAAERREAPPAATTEPPPTAPPPGGRAAESADEVAPPPATRSVRPPVAEPRTEPDRTTSAGPAAPAAPAPAAPAAPAASAPAASAAPAAPAPAASAAPAAPAPAAAAAPPRPVPPAAPPPDSTARPGAHIAMALAANLRAAPDGSAPVLGTVAAGTRVLVLARIGGWLQIGNDANRALGWVHVSRAEGARRRSD